MMVTGILADKGFHAFDAEPKSHTGLSSARIWVLVASGSEAYVYRKTPHGLERIARAEAKGRQMKSAGEHIFNPQSLNPDVHGQADLRRGKDHHEEVNFIERLIEWLDVAENEKAFDELVLVAAPSALGQIRACLTSNLRARVHGEINKELTRMSAAEVEQHLN